MTDKSLLCKELFRKMSAPAFLNVNPIDGNPKSIYALNVPLEDYPPYSQFVGEISKGKNPVLAKLLPIYLFLASRDPEIKWAYQLPDLRDSKKRKKKPRKKKKKEELVDDLAEEDEEEEKDEFMTQAAAMKESVKQHSNETISLLVEPLLDIKLKDVVALRFWIIAYSSDFKLSMQMYHFCMDKKFSEGHAAPLGEHATLNETTGNMDRELLDIQKNFVSTLKEPMHEETMRRCVEEYVLNGCAESPEIKTDYIQFMKNQSAQEDDEEDGPFSLANVVFSAAWAMHINVQGVNPHQVTLSTYFDDGALTPPMELPCSKRGPIADAFLDRNNFTLITARLRQKLGHPHYSSLFPIPNNTFEPIVYFMSESSIRTSSKKGADAFIATMNQSQDYCDAQSVYSPYPTRSGQFVLTSEFPEYDILDIVYALDYTSVKKLTRDASTTLHDVKSSAYVMVHSVINVIMEGLPSDVYGGIIEYALALTGSKPIGRLTNARAATEEKKKKKRHQAMSISRIMTGSIEKHIAERNDIDLRKHQNVLLHALVDVNPELKDGINKRACYRAIDMLFKSKNIPDTAKEVIEFINKVDDIRFQSECAYSNLPIFQNALIFFNTMTSLRGTTHHAHIQLLSFASAISSTARSLTDSECWPHLYAYGTASSGKSDCLNGIVKLIPDQFMKPMSHSTPLTFSAGVDNSYRIWKYEEIPTWLNNPNGTESSDSLAKTALTSPYVTSSTALRQQTTGDRDLCDYLVPKDGLVMQACGNVALPRGRALTSRFLQFNIEASREDAPGWSISDRSNRRPEDIKEYERLAVIHKKIFHLCMLANLVNKTNAFGMNAHAVEYGARLIENIIREAKGGDKVSPRLVEMIRKIAESLSVFKTVFFMGGSKIFSEKFKTGPKGADFDIREFIYTLWCNAYVGIDEVITSVALTSENITDMKHQRILAALSQMTDDPVFLEDYARTENREYVRMPNAEVSLDIGLEKTRNCKFFADPNYVQIQCNTKILAERVGKILNQTLDDKGLMEAINAMCAKQYTVKRATLEFKGEDDDEPDHVKKLMKQHKNRNKHYVIRRTINENEDLPIIVKERHEGGRLSIKVLVDVITKYKGGEGNMEIKSAIEKVIATESMSEEEQDADRFFGPPGSCKVHASNGRSYGIPSVYEASKVTVSDKTTVFPGRSMLTRAEYKAIGLSDDSIEDDEDEVVPPDFGIDNWILERHWKRMGVPDDYRIQLMIPSIGMAVLMKAGFVKTDASSVYPKVIMEQETSRIEKYINSSKKRKSPNQPEPDTDDPLLSMAAKRMKLADDASDLIRKFLPHFGTLKPPPSSLVKKSPHDSDEKDDMDVSVDDNSDFPMNDLE